MDRPHVILRRCADYDVGRIRGIVREGIEALGDPPSGRVLVKPNGVIAHRRYFPGAVTRAEFLDGVLGAVRDTAKDLTDLALGERCGITIPTRMIFDEAGWSGVVRKHGARACYFDEESQVEVKLTRTPRLRDYLYTPESVVRADYLVNCPKLKAHPWTTMTCALKNFIGIQDDAHRLIDHDHRLDEKIADLQEIVRQRFIAVDAIEAGSHRMMTPLPFPLGLVVLGNNPVAVDAVCAHILALDPRSVAHILASHRKGFGPLDLAEIQLDGDVTLEEAQGKAKGFTRGLVRVEKYFEGTNLRAMAGPPPDEVTHDYCWGGCPGALEESIEIVRRVDAQTDQKIKPMALVFGAYQGPIEPRPGEKIVFIGDCARWEGVLDGKPCRVESLYVDRAHRDPHKATMESIFTKMARGIWMGLTRRRARVLRLKGCPVSMAEQVLMLSEVGGTRDPYLTPAIAIPFLKAWLVSRVVRLVKRLFGMPARKRAALPAPDA